MNTHETTQERQMLSEAAMVAARDLITSRAASSGSEERMAHIIDVAFAAEREKWEALREAAAYARNHIVDGEAQKRIDLALNGVCGGYDGARRAIALAKREKREALKEAMERIAMAADSSVVNVQWIARHAREALANLNRKNDIR